MLYARKIEESAWMLVPELDADSISDLGTNKHELSVWMVTDDKSNIDDIALALALIKDKPDDMWVTFLDISEIEKSTKGKTNAGWKVELINQIGDSKYIAMNSKHTNIALTSMWEQGYLSTYIWHNIHNNINIQFFTITYLLALLRDRIEHNIIDYFQIKMNAGKWVKKMKEQFTDFKEPQKK